VTAADGLRATAAAARRYPADWVKASTAQVAKATRATLRADTGGDGALSNFRGGGPKARVKVTTRYGSTLSEATIEAAGAGAIWSWLEDGTGGHRIRARERGAELATPVGPRPSVHVRGRRPLHTWRRAVDPVLPRINADAERRWRGVVS
jgi:hypothetical protein